MVAYGSTLIVFGGRDGSLVLGDMWTFNLDTRRSGSTSSRTWLTGLLASEEGSESSLGTVFTTFGITNTASAGSSYMPQVRRKTLRVSGSRAASAIVWIRTLPV